MSSKIASAAPGLVVLVLIGYGAVHMITGSSTPAQVITPEKYKESADMEMTNFSNDLLGGHPDKSRECHILRDAANYYQRAGDQKDYEKAIGFQATLCE